MKTKNRFSKAFAVVVIIGITIVYNADYRTELYNQENIISEQIMNNTEETAKNDFTFANFISYSKTVLVSSIKQLISNR